MISFRLFTPIPDDPRVLMGHVELVSQSIASTAAGSPPWICLTALLSTGLFGYFGSVSPARAFLCVAIVTVAALAAQGALHLFQRERAQMGDAEVGRKWYRRLLQLDILISAAWGVVPWLLWQPGHVANHVFIELMSLVVVGRFLISRAGRTEFFLASFMPMATLLFVRFIVELQPVDVLLALLVPLYGIHLVLDNRYFGERIGTNIQLRFANEDMARELEEARDEALRDRAEAESANLSKTSFLANMSHELRTPLNAILGFSEIIARECLGPVGSSRYKEYASDIHDSGEHLLSLINDVLDVAKIEAGRMEIEPSMIGTQHLLESTLKLVEVHAHARRQSFTISVAPEASTIFADARALKQIILNLVANAVKFTHDGGNIRIMARRDDHGDFELVVEDDGPGIAQDEIDQLFQPFSQLNNRYDYWRVGTGLGLALVRGLAELHGGRAWLESKPGHGTRAHVVLPAPPHSAKQRAQA